jgi:hypothetical protein
VADADHVASTQDEVEAQRGQVLSQSRAALRAAIDETLAVVGSVDEDGAVLSMHGMRLSCRDLLVVRAFELWTHENDVRRALAMPPSAPDASTLALMTELAVRLLPHAARHTGQPVGRVDIRLVLTGAGGGTWDVPLGRPGEPAEGVLVVADAVDFCRVVAARLAPGTAEVHVIGAQVLADGVLEAAASLALD